MGSIDNVILDESFEKVGILIEARLLGGQSLNCSIVWCEHCWWSDLFQK